MCNNKASNDNTNQNQISRGSNPSRSINESTEPKVGTVKRPNIPPTGGRKK